MTQKTKLEGFEAAAAEKERNKSADSVMQGVREILTKPQHIQFGIMFCSFAANRKKNYS